MIDLVEMGADVPTPADLAALAAELGCADQSHLARAFRAVLGATPRGYGWERNGGRGSELRRRDTRPGPPPKGNVTGTSAEG